MFDWDDLRVFLAVARTRKIAPADQNLGPRQEGLEPGRAGSAVPGH